MDSGSPRPRPLAAVVGGNGSIGRAITQQLARNGCQVILCYKSNVDQAQSAVAALAGPGHEARRVSITEAESIASFAGHVMNSYGRLDILVNCAGVTRPVAHGDLDTLDDEIIDHIFQVNWRGAFATIRALRPALEKSGHGVIVNISSVAATTGQGSNVAYCASKAALDSMTRSLGRALAPGIRVVSVSPGFVEGPFSKDMPANILQAQRAETPLARLATAEDVARAVSAVTTSLPFSTGCVIPVDGGRPLGVH